MSENADTDQSEVIATPGREYRIRRYLFVGLMLAAGLWFFYDGFVGYPQKQDRFLAMTPEERAHATAPPTDLDIQIQKGLGLGLTLLAPICLGIFFYRSRGSYRMNADTLIVPGHPPVPFSQILELDKAQWDRKGIAKVTYRDPSGDASRTFRLDEFIYQYQAVRRIVARIEKYLENEAPAVDETPASPPAEA